MRQSPSDQSLLDVRRPDDMASEAFKLNVDISSNDDVDVGDVSKGDLDPDDMRVFVLKIVAFKFYLLQHHPLLRKIVFEILHERKTNR